MVYNWKLLAPTRPLAIAETDPGGLYVPRAGEGALEIDALLEAGIDQPIAVFGPAGAGKSTELAALAKRRARAWVGPFVRLDKLLTYSDGTSVDDVLWAIASFAVDLATTKLGMKLSDDVMSALAFFGAGNSGFDLLLATVREIRSASHQGEVGLLVDGLEKASPGLARRSLANLERLRGEARVVVVVPTEIATGPAAAALHDYHVVSIGAVQVSESVDMWMSKGPADGDRFLLAIAARRLGVQVDDIGKEAWDTTATALRHCIVMSGGLVRTSLQLLQKAALYGAMRGRQAPDEEDVARAASDQSSFLLRLLKEGDIDALSAAHGTSGVELDIERRVRFLANGLLLEYRSERGPVVRVAPLLAKAVLARGAWNAAVHG